MPFILERYVLRQVISAFLVGLFALTGMIFVGMAGGMMRQDFDIVQVLAVWPYLVLYALPFALPVALLCAVVMVFGRLAADNEITAARSSGVPPERLALPVLLLSAAISAGSFWIYQWALPTAHRRVDQHKELMMKMAMESLGVAVTRFYAPPYFIYVRTTDPATREWQDVVIIQIEGRLVRRVLRAKSGACRVDKGSERAQITLKECVVLEPEQDAAGIGALDKWLHTGLPTAGRDFQGAVTMGPSTLIIPVDLSILERRDPNRASLKCFPELRKYIAAMAEELRDAPSVPHPRTAHRTLSRRLKRLRLVIQTQDRSRAAEKRRLDELLAERRGLDQRIRTLRETVKSLEDRQTQFERQDKGLRAELSSKPPRSRKRRAEIRRELKVLAQSRRSLAARLRSEGSQLRDLGPDRAKADAEIGRQAPALKKLEADLAGSRRQFAELHPEVKNADRQETFLEAVVEYHSRNAAAATCLVFALVGIPLGILSHRGNVIYALALSMGVILLVYYPLNMIAQMLGVDGYVPVAASFWTPDVVVAGIGVALQALVVRR